jgi:hypothetical protein
MSGRQASAGVTLNKEPFLCLSRRPSEGKARFDASIASYARERESSLGKHYSLSEKKTSVGRHGRASNRPRAQHIHAVLPIQWRGFGLKRHQFQHVNIEFETDVLLAEKMVWSVSVCPAAAHWLGGPRGCGWLAYRIPSGRTLWSFLGFPRSGTQPPLGLAALGRLDLEMTTICTKYAERVAVCFSFAK